MTVAYKLWYRFVFSKIRKFFVFVECEIDTLFQNYCVIECTNISYKEIYRILVIQISLSMKLEIKVFFKNLKLFYMK